MNRIILLLILVVTFSCKDEKKKETEVATKVVEKQYKTVKIFTSDDLGSWNKNRVNLEPLTDVEFRDAYRLFRNSVTESAYLTSGLVPVIYASEYRVSVVVKKGTNNNFFGLRLSGAYPDRVDAIFDLEKGTVVDYKTAQDFENPMATIEKLTGDWYKCTLSAEVAADNVRIIMGATSTERNVLSWEGTTESEVDVHIVLSSVTIEELL
ncbi:phage head spike fiber domain-containing protein [Flavivirga jejuensis]|uniref:Lipoprotein n=1 Tax=Flavivirga jejuensis TaxID=870487 RepID=A0ABT8WQC3_9FLAO|nr:hypothetical protein [Flavivirga jejuensis]MDO5975346.1 hypothetical protein [Flavivirga jejuensis]